MTPEQLEFKIFLESYLLAMRAEHRRFMNRLYNRFIFGVLIIGVVYMALELIVRAIA